MSKRGVGGARPGAGRPRFEAGSGRSVSVSVKFSPAELAAIRALAESEGVSVSGWIRGCAIAPLGLARATDE